MLQCGIFEHQSAKLGHKVGTFEHQSAKLGHKLATLVHQFDRYRPFIPQKGET